MSGNDSSAPCPFVEIRPKVDDGSSRPRTIQAYAISVEPRQCSMVVKELSRNYPLPDDLQHLKRVKKPTPKDEEGKITNTSKKPKFSLQALVGIEKELCCGGDLEAKYGPVFQVVVPSRPPKSNKEWKEFNNQIWPTNFYPLKSEEYREQQLELQEEEFTFMKGIMDDHAIRKQIVVIVDPINRKIVASSDREQQERAIMSNNPLATPVLLAIQGVSRIEREAARNLSAVEFSRGQYLCTGYDLYSYYEPTVFEAMACVHSRLRRVIFSTRHQATGVWNYGCSKHRIHCLPGTNHRYRAFEYKQETSAQAP